MLEWHGHQIRLTFFPEAEIDPFDIQLWEHVVSNPAENEEINRPQVLRRLRGPFNENSVMELEIQPLRVDLKVSPIPNSQQPGMNFGPFEPVLDSLLDGRSTWINHVPLPLQRAALGLVLHSPVDSRKQGYQAITELVASLDFDTSVDGVSDLLFQINRRTASETLDGHPINRLMKWSVARLRRVQIELASDGPVRNTPRETYEAVRLELDINTAALSDRPLGLNSSQSVAIFGEFKELAVAILKHGELA